jgi:hypothetical protein
MSTSMAPQQGVSVEILKDHGLTDEAVARLMLLRETYPYLEFCETEQEWQRLRFLRWRIHHGDLGDAVHRIPAGRPGITTSVMLQPCRPSVIDYLGSSQARRHPGTAPQ